MRRIFFLGRRWYTSFRQKKKIDFENLHEVEAYIRRSNVKTIFISFFILLSSFFSLVYLNPVWHEYSWFTFGFIVVFVLLFISTSMLILNFSPISAFASERLLARKAFRTLQLIAYIPLISSIYLTFGLLLTDLQPRSSKQNQIDTAALNESGYIQRLPDDRKLRVGGTASKGDEEVLSSFRNMEIPSKYEYVVMLRSDAINFLVFIFSSKRVFGFCLVVLLIWATWLDTILIAWRVKKGVYGFNAFEATELSEFVWKSESGDGDRGRWTKGPVWTRLNHEPSFVVVNP